MLSWEDCPSCASFMAKAPAPCARPYSSDCTAIPWSNPNALARMERGGQALPSSTSWGIDENCCRNLMEKLKPVLFPSAGSHPVQLEGLFHFLEGEGPWPAAIVCHPHPLGGGTMHNSVVTAIARALAASGIMALRFNFRGVERSGGEHDNGRGEQADVAGALDWLLTQPGINRQRVSVAGYSFGAWVALSHAQADPRVAAAAAVGLVAWRFDADFYQLSAGRDSGVQTRQFDPDFLRSFTRPKLFVTGEWDAFAPPEAVRGLVDRLPPPKSLCIVPGTDHFFGGREREAGRLVAEFISGL